MKQKRMEWLEVCMTKIENVHEAFLKYNDIQADTKNKEYLTGKDFDKFLEIEEKLSKIRYLISIL